MESAGNKLRMKDLPVCERPYEKLEKHGAEILSNAELLAVLIKTGSRGETSVDLAQRILKQGEESREIAYLCHASLEELKSLKGVGRVKAIQLKAFVELAKRMAAATGFGKRAIVKTPEDISRLLMEEMRYLQKEVFRVVILNTKNHVLKQLNISVGSLNASIVHPREVFNEAVKCGCSAVILVHNHPSGDPAPSPEDLETTRRLAKAGEILGIHVLDHIIIGDGRYVSLKEKGII